MHFDPRAWGEDLYPLRTLRNPNLQGPLLQDSSLMCPPQ